MNKKIAGPNSYIYLSKKLQKIVGQPSFHNSKLVTINQCVQLRVVVMEQNFSSTESS